MKRIATHLLLACVLPLLAGCEPSSSEMGSAQLAVSMPQALSASVSRVSITALGAEVPAVSVDLALSGSTWGGMLGNLPAGSHRTFLAQAFDAAGTQRYEGSASGISIAANQSTLVAITLQQVNAPPPFQNEAPIIDSLTAPTPSVVTGGVLTLEASAHDPNAGDTLTYSWSSAAGTFTSASSASTVWTAPATTGLQTLALTVTDSQGLASTLSLTVSVTPSLVLGIAHASGPRETADLSTP
ncbi:PKD domain-containing protein [Hyalangium minutum]|uniref:High-affinity leucine-specific transport system, periplasmic binding protein LivK n=1 Tax=Hyalangium minutum TaxID=394096 RepID=A0A085WC98_9BACT|nr:PKD domain-containing protein [Hyalangium minutum]KFE65311.1 High-affinity leucine-specific transport system, periplasmic binding protein LivK [Hyalangium minutum]